MDEKVLVLNRKNIPIEWLQEKISTKILQKNLEDLLPYIQWKDRDRAELDETVKQIIPYLIIESGNDNKIAVYQRKGSEKRIHGLHSIGVGGHINPDDFKHGDKFIDLILRSAKREVLEEFETIDPSKNIKFLGVINEELTKVGRTHIGLVFKLQIKGKGTASHELHNLHWLYKNDILKNYKLEMWSKMALSLDINIFDYFNDLQLAKDQTIAINKLQDFLLSNKQVFILKGYAGTGKTTILKGISEYLSAIDRLGHIMAPTGRAAMVIKNKTKYPATTIHKAIYDLKNIKTYKHIDKDGNETFKFYFDFPTDADDMNKVYIFDESSMISNMYSDGEFFRFGSGHLLHDILKFYNPNKTTNTKLIFVGDPAQLPPVGSNKSDALDIDFFNSKKLLIDEIEMTDVIRQSEHSGILKNAGYYRKLIFSNIVSENTLDTNYDDIKEIEITDAVKIYSDISPIPNTEKCIIITYSNALALTYNKIIRENYFPEEHTIVAGDILQIVKNNYSNQQVELLNGDFVKVLEISNEVEIQSARIKKKEADDVVIKHYFRKIKLVHITGVEVEIMILDSFLNGKQRDLSSDETKALYINFIMRYEKRIGGTANKKSEEFKEAFRNDPYYNALQVKYGYAITGHKSQGGEWKNVFVDFSGRIGTHNDVLRWSYTAVTRASEKLYVLNPPKLKQIDFSKIKKITIGKISKVPKGAIKYPDVNITPFHTTESLPAKRIKYFEVNEILEKEGYKIQSVASQQYLEKYRIKKDTNLLIIDMYHDAEGIFTRYISSSKNEIIENVIRLISKNRPWPYEFNYNSKDTFLYKIYQNILSAMQGLNIQILNIDDSKKSEFHVNYFFRTEAQIAHLQIYFNKKEIVSSIIAKSMLGTNDLQLNKLIENLKNTN